MIADVIHTFILDQLLGCMMKIVPMDSDVVFKNESSEGPGGIVYQNNDLKQNNNDSSIPTFVTTSCQNVNQVVVEIRMMIQLFKFLKIRSDSVKAVFLMRTKSANRILN